LSQTNFDNLVYLRLLLSIEGIGPLKIFSLLSRLHSFDRILLADFNSLLQVEGISKTLATKIKRSSDSYNEIKSNLIFDLEKLNSLGGQLVTYWDEDYPELLKKIYFPPLIIYTLGNFIEQDKYSLAIVGTRQPSPYGKIQTEKFSIGSEIQWENYCCYRIGS